MVTKKTTAKKKVNSEDSVMKLAKCIWDAADDIKAEKITCIDIRPKAQFADNVFICSGASDRQVKSIANSIQEKVKKELKKPPFGVEGEESGQWILIDYGDIVCHVFLDEIREFYRLEDLWHGCPQLEL